MEPHRVHAIDLTCHPATPSSAVHGIDVRVCRRPHGVLQVTYALHADLARVRIPAPGVPERADRLWEHTCFELFVRREGAPAYHEFNFSPSGAWAAYAFDDYRAGAALNGPAVNPHVSARRSEGELMLETSIRLDLLYPLHARVKLALAISAVIEDSRGTLSYWALRHPPGKPDFHHPDAYAFELDA